MVREYDDDNMKKLLQYVKNEIPYFKELLKDVNISTTEADTLYQMLPFQSKELMRDNILFFNPQIDPDGEELVTKVTGGTTGEPWNITKTANEYMRYFTMLWKSRLQFGIVPGNHFYQFGGYGEIDGAFTTKQVIVTSRFTELSMFHLSDEILDEYIDIINEGKGNWFFANPSALYLLALRMKDRGIKGLGKIKYIELTGEKVYKYQERLIQEVFDCPVSIMYGSREITTISHRCRYGKLHIFPNVFVDIVDEKNKSIVPNGRDRGEIVITSYIDRYMPFIKYRTGDFGIVDKIDDCPCGCKGLYFKALDGRIPAYVMIDGIKVHMEVTYYLMDKYNRIYGEGVRQFQAIFKKPNIFHFMLVIKSDDLRDRVREFYINELKSVVPNAEVEVEFVTYIERVKRKLNPFVIE